MTKTIAQIQEQFGSLVAFDAASHKPALMFRTDLTGQAFQLIKVRGGYRVEAA